jgi:hypothetical protein
MEAKSPMHPNIIEQPDNPIHKGQVQPNDDDTREGNTDSNNQNRNSKSSSLNFFSHVSKKAHEIWNKLSGYTPLPDDPIAERTNDTIAERTNDSTDGQTNDDIFSWIPSFFIPTLDSGDAVGPIPGDVYTVPGNVSTVPGDVSTVPGDVSVAVPADDSGDVSATQSGVLTTLRSVPGVIWNGISSMASSSPTPRIIGFKPLLLQGPSLQYVFLLLLFVILIIYFITYVVYIKSNWEDVKCREGRFWLAPLFGKDTDETIRDCTSRQIQISIDNTLEAENTRMYEIEQMVIDLSNNVTEYSGDSLALGEGAEGEMSNITDTLQHNVNYVKEALSTILASIWISTQMNNGALTSYSDLQSSEISNIIDKYNNVDGNFNTYQ